MNNQINLNLTDSALEKIRGLIATEGDPSLMLRVLWQSDDQKWQFSFETIKNPDDLVLEYVGLTVLLESNLADSLSEASIDFSEDSGFVIRNSETPNCEAGCSHLAQLPPMPSEEQLKTIRKGLRKQKPPNPSIQYGEHDKIGQFAFEHQDGGVGVRWNVAGGKNKCAFFSELCASPERELDRLELGWMIANMAKLDMEHQLERAREIPHPVYCQKEMSRIKNHFEEIEKRWRHWAIVPAGYMLKS